MAADIKKIVGFDLGHGETSLSAIDLMSNDSKPRPYVLEIGNKKVSPTAIAYDARRGILLGRVAIKSSLQANEFYIGFKDKPKPDALYKRLISDYLLACIKQAKPELPSDETIYYVGCPSGWSVDTIKTYQEVLSLSGIPNLHVVRESRAALLQANEEGHIEQGQLKGAILLIDVGSSTTDCTLLFPDESTHPFDFGNELGASLIDKAILAHSLASSQEKKEIENAFIQDPKHRYRCEYKCREVKEDYFNDNEDSDDEFWNAETLGHEIIQGSLNFYPELDYNSMQQLLRKPIAKVAGKLYSWPDAFRQTLKMAKKYIEKNKKTPSIILLTGGASRMNFIEKICQETFPDTPIKREKESEHTVSKGLALYGRVELRTNAFEEKINVFVKNDLPNLLKASMPKLLQNMAGKLAESMLREVIQPDLARWKNRSIETLNDIEPVMRNSSKAWAKSQKVEQIVLIAVKKWLEEIKDMINSKTDSICREFGVPTQTIGASVLNTQAKITSMNDFDVSVGYDPELYGNIVGAILVFIVGVLAGDFLFLSIFGGLIAPIVLLFVFFYGKEKTEQAIKSWAIPKPIRGLVLSDKKIKKVCEERKPEIRSRILHELDKEEFKKNISSSMTKLVSDSIETEVKRLLLLVR